MFGNAVSFRFSGKANWDEDKRNCFIPAQVVNNCNKNALSPLFDFEEKDAYALLAAFPAKPDRCCQKGKGGKTLKVE